MRSKNLFFNMMRENLKRRILFIAVGILTFFFLFPVAAAMNFSKAVNMKSMDLGLNDTDVINEALSKTFWNDGLVSIITCILAVILAIQGFSYLFSRSRTDLYHALPVKREVLFFTAFLNGIFIYVAAYVINLVLSLAISGIYGLLTMQTVLHVCKALLIHAVFFLIIYSTVVLATILTGNLITAILGSMVFLFYVSILYEVIRSYVERFFYTHYSEWWDSRVRDNLSPVLAYKNAFHYQVFETSAADLLWKSVLIIAAAAVLVMLALFLYKRYPSEAAGRSMSFPVSKNIIKSFLMVPIALRSGLFFESVNGYGKAEEGWLIFGLMIGLLLSHAVIEMIYEFDMKAGLHNRKQIIIPTIVVAVIFCIFRFDLFRYDVLPPKDKIESVGIAFSNSNWLGGTDSYKKDENGNFVRYMEEPYIFDHMNDTDMDVIYPLLEEALKDVSMRAEFYFSVEYRLTGGKKMRRRYVIDENKNKEVIHTLFESREFKEGMYPIYSCSDEELSAMNLSFINGDEETLIDHKRLPSTIVSLGEEEKKELIRTYKEELYQLKYEDAYFRTAIGKLSFQPKEQNYTMYAYIYPGFEKTLQLLQPYR